jgi:hypothetical protein
VKTETTTPVPPCYVCSKRDCTDAAHPKEDIAGSRYVVAYAQLAGAVEWYLEQMKWADANPPKRSKVSRDVAERMNREARDGLAKRLAHLTGITV